MRKEAEAAGKRVVVRADGAGFTWIRVITKSLEPHHHTLGRAKLQYQSNLRDGAGEARSKHMLFTAVGGGAVEARFRH